MDESMLYAMNYVPDGKNKSHKQGRGTWMDEHGECAYPIDKNGKIYYLENVKCQHACKWVLFNNIENAKWKEIYEEYIQPKINSSKPKRTYTSREDDGLHSMA